MDRQITKEEKDLARRKKLIKSGILGGSVLVAYQCQQRRSDGE